MPVGVPVIHFGSVILGQSFFGSTAGDSSLGEESRNLVRGNGTFANDAPTRGLIRQINDRGSDIARGGAAIDDDADAAVQLLAHLLGAGALGGAAEIGGSRGDGDRRRSHNGPRYFSVGYAQCDVAGVGRDL